MSHRPMFRYRLRTLLTLLALGPPMLAWWAWPPIEAICFPKPLPQVTWTKAHILSMQVKEYGPGFSAVEDCTGDR
jgi:hypothetical protein